MHVIVFRISLFPINITFKCIELPFHSFQGNPHNYYMEVTGSLEIHKESVLVIILRKTFAAYTVNIYSEITVETGHM